MQNTLALLKEKENDTTDKVKRTLDVAEQAQYEKNVAEQEIRRLKDELERQHLKLRDAIADQVSTLIQSVNAGDLQGSVLVPKLCLLHINDFTIHRYGVDSTGLGISMLEGAFCVRAAFTPRT